MADRPTFDPATDEVDYSKLSGTGSRWRQARVAARGDETQLLAAILDEQKRANDLLAKLLDA